MPFTGRSAAGLRDAPFADGHRLVRHRRRGEDGRSRAAAAVAEHPAVARGVEAVELLGEVLDHVGPFELAVHEDVDPGGLLPGHRLGDHAVDLALVARAIDLAARQSHAELPDLARLRQRPGARRREERQVEVRLGGLPLLAAGARANLADLRPLAQPAVASRRRRRLRRTRRPSSPARRPSRGRTRSPGAGPRPRPCRAGTGSWRTAPGAPACRRRGGTRSIRAPRRSRRSTRCGRPRRR